MSIHIPTRIIRTILLLSVAVFLIPLATLAQTSYRNQWNEIEKADNKGLPKTALAIAEDIYKQSKKVGDTDDYIKSLLTIAKYRQQATEETLADQVYFLVNELSQTTGSARAILHSVIGEMYWHYFQNNRWQILQRSELATDNSTDIEQWSAPRFLEAASSHYRASLYRGEYLAETPLKSINLLLSSADAESALICPSVYDFVAMRAILFFSSAEREFTAPEKPFEISGARYFSLADDFCGMQIPQYDTVSSVYQAVRAMQAYSAHCLSSAKIPSLIHTELFRLAYMYEHSAEYDTDRWYTESLERLFSKHNAHPRAAYILHAMAERQRQLAQRYDHQDKGTYMYRDSYIKAVEYAHLAIEQFPKEAPALWCKQMIETISQPEVSFRTEPEIASRHRQAVQIEYNNIRSCTISIRRISQPLAESILSSGRRKDEEISQKLFASSKEVFADKIVLPQTANYRFISTDYLLPVLPKGHYVFFINANTPESSWMPSFQTIRVSDLVLLRRVQVRQVTYQVLDRTSGEPVAGAKISIEGTKRDCYADKGCVSDIGVLTTGKDGRAEHTVPEKINAVKATVFRSGDTLISAERDYLYNTNVRTNELQASIAIFTDRGIYRPGQAVYFKVIAWRGTMADCAVLASEALQVEVRDPNYQIVKTFAFTTNEYGSAATSFVLPQTGLNGQFTITVSGKNISGSKQISVEDYKRPLIQITLNDLTETYAAGDTIALTGELSSYSGAGLGAARLLYTVYTQPMHWRSWRQQASQKIASGELISESDGTFTLVFPTDIQNKLIRDATTVNVTVTAIDSNGETQSSQKILYLPAEPFIISADISSVIDIAQGMRWDIFFSNANGIPVKAQGKAFLVRLLEPSSPMRSRLWPAPDTALYSQDEWRKLYPGNPFANEHDIQYQQIADTLKEFILNSNTSVSLSYTNEELRAGSYAVLVEATDSKGRMIVYEKRFRTWDSNKAAEPANVSFRCIPIKSAGTVGDFASFAIQAEEGTYIVWEVEKEGVLLDKKIFKAGRKTEIIRIPLTNAMRGNAFIHFTAYHNGRNYSENHTISVPFADRELQLQFASMRSSILPGNTEKWTISIKNSKGEAISAEIAAGMYDASLDVFVPNVWNISPFRQSSPGYYWSVLPLAVRSINSHLYAINYSPVHPQYPELNTFGVFYANASYLQRSGGMLKMSMSGNVVESEFSESITSRNTKQDMDASPQTVLPSSPKPAETIAAKNMSRSNMRETAFFYPQLNSLPDGSAEIIFTVPDALTRWNFQALAHTKNMSNGMLLKSVVTQKKLMIQPNWPRFVREGDTINIFARVSNLTDSIMLGGTASISIIDALTGEQLALIKAPSIRTFNVGRKGSTAISWQLVVPQGATAISCKIVCAVSNYSDGEERTLPVLTNRILVTQSIPLSVSGAGQKQYRFDALKLNKSKTLSHQAYSVEFSSNPAWYAIQALPYLIEAPYECAEQSFSRMYANSIGGFILSSSPLFASVFEQWRVSATGESLLSALEKNQELKSLLIEETPWLRDAKNESEQKKRLAQLFDTDLLRYEADKAAGKLAEMQLSSGAWPWFRGGQPSRYISQYIICGLGKLRMLTGSELPSQIQIELALRYADSQILEDYTLLLRDKTPLVNQNINDMHAYYLYMRSFFPEIAISKNAQEAYAYYQKQAGEFWPKMSVYAQGMIALSLSRAGKDEVAREIIASINECAIDNEELGRYWKLRSGWNWNEAPIETQSLLIEAVSEITGDTVSVNAMKLWLIKQKQTQHWPSTKATADAVYALMLRGDNSLTDTRQVTVTVGGNAISTEGAEAGTGYVKHRWPASEIAPSLADIQISNPVNRPAWGAAHWQYFEDLDKITADATGPLKITKQLFVSNETPQGKKLYAVRSGESIQVGSLVVVRIVVESDRAMDFVHLKDMRAAAFEPQPSLSGYRWQGGLAYYQTIRDAAAHFFIDYLPAGKYVFEYELRAQQAGQFSNGITSIQCMYAPEFGSRSNGIRVKIDK